MCGMNILEGGQIQQMNKELNKLSKATIKEIKETIYSWTCPTCALKQTSRHKPTDGELECWRCKAKERHEKNQKKLEELFLCAKVVKIEAVLNDSQYDNFEKEDSQIKRITLLSSDDKTLIHINMDIEDEDYDYQKMTFHTEEVEAKKEKTSK
jgi:hypothetical protein